MVTVLQQQAKIEPDFTQLVWQKLEEQNPEFFRMYHVRLKLKDQIVMFNYLLEQQVCLCIGCIFTHSTHRGVFSICIPIEWFNPFQVNMVQKLYTSWIQSLPPPMAPPGLPGMGAASGPAAGTGCGASVSNAPRPPGPMPPGMPPFPFPPGMMLPPPGMMPPPPGMMMGPPPGLMPPMPPGMMVSGPGGGSSNGVHIPGMMMPMAGGYPQMSFPPMPPLGAMPGGPGAFSTVGPNIHAFGSAMNMAGVDGGRGSKRASRTGMDSMEGLDEALEAASNGLDSSSLAMLHGSGVDDLIDGLGGLGGGDGRKRTGYGHMMEMPKNFSFSDLSNFDLTTIGKQGGYSSEVFLRHTRWG